MKRLKFCMVTTFYPPYNFGGDGIFVQRLTNAIARRGHEVHVVHDLDAFALLSNHIPQPTHQLPSNVTLHTLSKGKFGSLDLILSHQFGRPVVKNTNIKHILEGINFDVIHFHNISLMGGPHVLKYGDAIKLCTMHDYWFVCAMHVLWRFNREACSRRTCLACTVSSHRPPQLWRYNGALERLVQHVDTFITPSKSSREIHIANGFPAPIRHISYFLPDSEVNERDAFQEPIHPATQQPYFLFVGRLEKIKGLQFLIDVFRKYRKADLLIAGDGNFGSYLREKANDLPHVHFLGKLTQLQLRGLYQKAIATIVPSVVFETFGWVPLESFALRTPVIVNNIGALPEVVQTEGGGLVYNSNKELVEAMETIRKQPEIRNKLGEQGYQSYMKNYSEEGHIEKYFSLIAEHRNLC